MIGEIIAIGDELTSGRIVNTTSGFAASQLFAAGHEIFAMHTIGDSPAMIGEALRRAITRADFVIVTGGLGATSDDMTNQAVSEALNRPPTLHRDILAHLQANSRNNAQEQQFLEKLAWLPQGAEIFDIQAKMAGYLLVYDQTPIFFLPGIPRQMKELLINHVLPCLAGWSTDHRNHFRQKVYRTFGLSENTINSRLRDIEKIPHISLGYYPVESEVHVSLTVSGKSRQQSDSLFAEADAGLSALLEDALYGVNQESMAQVVGKELLRRHLRLSVAESCTGGLVGAKITEVPGSSDWFEGGIIAYSNELKKKLLTVDSRLLADHGAVSAQVARAMATGAALATGSPVSVAVTGIAGPSGGSPDKPVGTVFLAVYIDGRVTDHLYTFSGSRKEVQEITAQTALDLVRRALLKLKGEDHGKSS